MKPTNDCGQITHLKIPLVYRRKPKDLCVRLFKAYFFLDPKLYFFQNNASTVDPTTKLHSANNNNITLLHNYYELYCRKGNLYLKIAKPPFTKKKKSVGKRSLKK